MAIDIRKISKLGLGGLKDFDPSINQQQQIEAVTYTLNQGVSYAEVTMWYSEGHAAEILAQSIAASKKDREEIFLSQAIYEYDHPTFETIDNELIDLHHIFETDYSDAITLPMNSFNKYGFDKVCNWLDKKIINGQTRYVSTTNADKEFLELLHKRFGDKLFAHEVHINFEIREMERLKIIATADKFGVRNVIAQPLRRNRTALHEWPLLTEIAKKYNATQNQIILAWMVARNFLPLIKSTNTKHINENLGALEILLEDSGIVRINNWLPNYKLPEIDWHNTGVGVTPHQLANVFDDDYKEQMKAK